MTRGSFFPFSSRLSLFARPVLTLLPQHIAPSAATVEDSREHEQQVGKPVEIAQGEGRSRVRQGNHAAFRPAAYGARDMGATRRPRAGRQHEVLERRQVRVEPVERGLQLADVPGIQYRV